MAKRCMNCMEEIEDDLQKCSHCGHDVNSNNRGYLLSQGFLLKEKYLVGQFLNYQGIYATYIGWDFLEKRKVFIDEFFPNGLAVRDVSKRGYVKCAEEGRCFIPFAQKHVMKQCTITEN